MNGTFHQCPGPRCQATIARSKLARVGHWAQVPRPVQRAVYAAWDGGRGAGTVKHHAAIDAAIRAMTELEGP